MGCYNSIVVDASVEKVWKMIREFHDLGWGSPVVTSVEKLGETPGDQVGAQRILNGVFHETLQELDDYKCRFQYSIDEGPGPISKDLVSNYLGTVQLRRVTASDATFVEWRSEFVAGDPDKVADFCNPIYSALLGALKNNCES